ncbi:hypothetical protein R1flu_014739 [Riccia fluitans]|uniref:Uncharacterized protein n=1 Tax=Riccia fluitans TaxID=41844 RepID=A0ABD1YHD1_9MARC
MRRGRRMPTPGCVNHTTPITFRSSRTSSCLAKRYKGNRAPRSPGYPSWGGSFTKPRRSSIGVQGTPISKMPQICTGCSGMCKRDEKKLHTCVEVALRLYSGSSPENAKVGESDSASNFAPIG